MSAAPFLCVYNSDGRAIFGEAAWNLICPILVTI